MSISQRKDGRWCVKYKIDTPTGPKWTQRSFPKDKEAEARAFDAEMKYDEPENTRPTLLECVLAYVKEMPLAEHTARGYEFLVVGCDRKDGIHVAGPAEFLADRFADTLTKRDLLAFRDACRAVGNAEPTVALKERRLKAALRWCAGEDIIPENPWAKYAAPRVRHGSRQGTLEDFRKVYALLAPHWQWASRTSMALCLRPGETELASLRWQSFRWREQCVSVYMGKVKATKTVYPPEDYMAEARARFEASGDAGGFVCPGRGGGRMTYEAFRCAWRNACHLAGVKIVPYAMRHIGATEMLARGIDLAAVAAQLGHRNLTTTGAFYSHALPSAQKAAAKALPDCTTLGADGAEAAEK